MLLYFETISNLQGDSLKSTKDNFLKFKDNNIQYPLSVIYEYITNIFAIQDYNSERDNFINEITNVLFH
jgi:hypothetical protein